MLSLSNSLTGLLAVYKIFIKSEQHYHIIITMFFWSQMQYLFLRTETFKNSYLK